MCLAKTEIEKPMVKSFIVGYWPIFFFFFLKKQCMGKLSPRNNNTY